MTSMKTSLLLLFFSALIIYIAILAFLYFYQEKLLFPAKTLPSDHTFSFDLSFEEVNIPVEGAQLNALHFKGSNAKGVVFFLHGNVGNLETWTTGVGFFQDNQYDLFIFDYRGYGKSTGKIQSQQQLYDDVEAAWQFIAEQYPGEAKVIYGRSLGSNLAANLARKVDAELLVMVSAFNSMEEIALSRYPFIPAAILRYPFNTEAIITDVSIPTVFFHGDNDNVVPLSHGQNLAASMKNNPELIIIQGAAHTDIHEFDHYLNRLAEWLPD